MAHSSFAKGDKTLAWMMAVLSERAPSRHRIRDGVLPSGKAWGSERHQLPDEGSVTCVHVFSSCGKSVKTDVVYGRPLPILRGKRNVRLCAYLREFVAPRMNMFVVDSETGEVRLGTFFPSNFELTDRLDRVLTLQEFQEPRTFGIALLETIQRCGMDTLREIYAHHLDDFEYRYRLEFPLDEFALKV